jgi:hypothetical protein
MDTVVNLWGDPVVGAARLAGETNRRVMGDQELTGRLSVLLVGLDLPGSELRARPISASDCREPFLQARVEGTQHWQVPPVRPGERAPVELLAARVIELPGSGQVFFGASAEDLAGRFRDELTFTESLSLSLWNVPDCAPVLAVELLAHTDNLVSSGWDANGWATDAFQDIMQGGEWLGFRPALSEWLALAGLDLDLSLAALLDADLGRGSERSIPDLMIMSNETVRGRVLVEGLRIHVETDPGDRVRSLVEFRDPEDCAEEGQKWGVVWRWDVERIVAKPAVADACLAVRQDSREVYLNLNALSSNHDYVGLGGSELVYDALAYVGYRASIARDFGAILEGLQSRGDAQKYLNLLRLVEDVRAGAVRRALLRRETYRTERFTTWTFGTQLRSLLFSRTREEIDAVSGELELAAKVVDEIVRRKQEEVAGEAQQHQGKIDLWASAFAVALTLFTAIGLFASLAAIPRDGSGTLFGRWTVPAAVTMLLTMAIAGLAFLLVRRVTTSRRRDRRSGSGVGFGLLATRARGVWRGAWVRLREVGLWTSSLFRRLARRGRTAGPRAKES